MKKCDRTNQRLKGNNRLEGVKKKKKKSGLAYMVITPWKLSKT